MAAFPAPDWPFLLALMLGSVLLSSLWGLLLLSRPLAFCMRGCLEYTTVRIRDLRDRRPLCKFRPREADELAMSVAYIQTLAKLMCWTEQMTARYEDTLREEAQAAARYAEADAADLWDARRALVEAKATTFWVAVTNALALMPLPFRILVPILYPLAVPVVGAFGFFLMTTMAHMPNRHDDQDWIEYAWQTLNGLFSVLAVWRGPQRVALLAYVLLHRFEVTVEGDAEPGARSLVVPGVLLKRRQLLLVAGLRVANLCAQSLCSFFMWGYLPGCLEEERSTGLACKSRPPWGVPIFLILGMGTDIVQGALLDKMVASCPYISWDDDMGVDETVTTYVVDVEAE